MGLAVNIRQAAPTSRVMVVAVMVSMVAFLDSTVVNLALGTMILPGGSISDLFGRAPVMRFGLVPFGVGSVLAATAPAPAFLKAGRVVQGLGAAYLVPGSPHPGD